MTYPEELARVRANLAKLEAFAEAHPWLPEAIEYCSMHPSDPTPRIAFVCREPVTGNLRNRLAMLTKDWVAENGSGTDIHWTTRIDGIELNILCAAKRVAPVAFTLEEVAS
jgi:hypothetical protein